MEALAVLVGLLVAAIVFVFPILALVIASKARRETERLRVENEDRARELRWLYDRVKALEATPPSPRSTASTADAAEAARPSATPGADAAQRDGAAPDTADDATQPSAPARLPDGEASDEADHAGDAPTADPRPEPEAGARDAGPPEAPPRRDTQPPRAPPPKVPFEQALATWFTRIGAGAFLLGLLFGFKYLADNSILGPTGRVASGALAGVAMLIGAEVIRRTTVPAFVHALTGLGLAALFVATYASSAFYDLVPVGAAFAVNAVLLFLGAALAWRHQAEAVLVLVSIAGFLNPVLLSTGQDRPGALFGYLFVVTAVCHLVAVRLRFRIAIAVAIAGVAVVAAGWYERYFQTFDLRGSGSAPDLPPEELVGAYHALSTRLVPLVALAAFTAQWVAVGVELQRRHAARTAATAVVLAGLLASHAGVTALLFDQPVPLAVGMLAAAVVAIGALGWLERTQLLLVPMLAAAAALAARTADLPEGRLGGLLALLTLWSGAYLAAFLRAERPTVDLDRPISEASAWRASLVLWVLAGLTAALLGPIGALGGLAALLAVLGAGGAALAIRAERAVLLGVGGLVTAAVAAAAHASAPDPEAAIAWAYLGATGLWALVHVVAALVLAVRSSGAPGQGANVLVAATAPVLWVGLAVQATPDTTPTLRALVAGLAGLTTLGAATMGARRGIAGAWTPVLAALALGLFATAFAFALSGATVTVLWALLAAVAAWLWGRDGSPIWGAALVLLASATLLRLLAVDLGDIDQALRAYRWSEGREGLYRLRPVLNPRALALGGTALALLGAALGLRRAADRLRRTSAGVLAVLGYGLALACGLSELRELIVELPEAPPLQLDAAEFSAWWETVEEARRAQRGKFSMLSTLVLAGAAMSVLAAGFRFRDPFHRYLGLALFVGTIGKLVFYDVWQLSRLYQMVVLTFVGTLLLLSGFLYARLRSWFTAAAGLLLAASLLGAARPADAAEPPLDPSPYRQLRRLKGIESAGDHRLDVDADLYRASASERPLDDVRIVGPDGLAVPWVSRELAPPRPPPELEPRPFDFGVPPEGGHRASFELDTERRHCLVRLKLQASGEYLQRVRIEAGPRLDDLAVVAEGAPVYALRRPDGTRDDSSDIRYPESAARYVRVTLLPNAEGGSGARIQGAGFSCPGPSPRPLRDPVPLSIVSRTRDEANTLTILELDAGGEGLPIDELVVEVARPEEFLRRVRVAASSFRSVWPWAGGGVLYGIGGRTGLSIRTDGARKRWWRLEIVDGDDAPIEVASVVGQVRRRELILRSRGPGEHLLYVGDRAGRAPSYDLDEILARSGATEAAEASAGPLEPNPRFGEVVTDATLPWTEQHRGPIGVGLAILLLGLSLWAVRLVRTGGAPPAGPDEGT